MDNLLKASKLALAQDYLKLAVDAFVRIDVLKNAEAPEEAFVSPYLAAVSEVVLLRQALLGLGVDFHPYSNDEVLNENGLVFVSFKFSPPENHKHFYRNNRGKMDHLIGALREFMNSLAKSLGEIVK